MRLWPMLLLAAISVLLSIFAPAPAPGLAWWTTHSLEKIRPFDKEPAEASHSVKIYAGRNEFEPFQIVLRAEGQDISNVDVECTDLRGENGSLSAAQYITVYLEHYLNLSIPSSITGGTGEWPDPLIPRIDRYANEKRNAFPFNLTRDRDQPLWIDVYVPPATAPGLYKGQVHVLTGGKLQLSIPVELEVWNFKLPSTSSLITAFGFSGNLAVRSHYGRYTTDQAIADLTFVYEKAALWHRITLNSNAGISPIVRVANDSVQINWEEYDKVIGPLMDGRLFSRVEPLFEARGTSVALSTPHLLTTPELQTQFWRQTAEHFRKKGWSDRLFNYLWDEPKQNDFAAMTQLGRTVRSADPTLKNLVTAPLHAEWSDFIDIWTPAVNCFEKKPHHGGFCNPNVDRPAYDPELSNGKQLWWYQACGSHGCFIVGGDYFRGWPSYVIDDAPVRNRIMEWLTWKYNIRGELYYSTDEGYHTPQGPWKDVHIFGGNGDGTLFYPGRPDVVGGATDIPIESIRLKLIREGLEDYEYLRMLDKLSGDNTVAELMNKLIRNAYDYEQDPQKLYAIRELIGRELSKRSIP